MIFPFHSFPIRKWQFISLKRNFQSHFLRYLYTINFPINLCCISLQFNNYKQIQLHFPNKLFWFDIFSLGKPKKRSKISSNSIQSLVPEIMECIGKKEDSHIPKPSVLFFPSILSWDDLKTMPKSLQHLNEVEPSFSFFFFLYTKYREIELDYKKNLQSGGKTMDTPMQLYKGRRNWTISWGLFWLWMDYLLWFDFSHALNYAVDVSWQVIRVILHVSQDHVKLFLKSCTSLSLTL